MTAFVVRSEADAWWALNALSLEDGGGISSLKFKGWPRLVIESTSRIDSVLASRAICRMQEAVERQFALLKFGKRDRRRLSDGDKAAVRITADQQLGGRRLVLDLSRAANAGANVVKNWDTTRPFGRHHSAIGSLFDPILQNAQPDPYPTTWPGAVTAISLAAIKKARPRDVLAWGFLSIIVAGLVAVSPLTLKVWSAHTLASQKLADERQIEIAELQHTTIVPRNSTAQKVSETTKRAVERDLEWDSRRARMLALGEFNDPLLKFVVNEANDVRPALLNLVAEFGTIDFNGLTLTAKTARAIAKAKPALQKVKPRESSWTATVIRS